MHFVAKMKCEYFVLNNYFKKVAENESIVNISKTKSSS